MNQPTPKPWEHAKHGEGSAADPIAARFVESLSFDTRLFDADIRGSLAHASMLRSVGLISEPELKEIRRGLAEIRDEIEAAPAGPRAVGVAGAWPGWKIELEDVHMCIESALIERVGEPGRKLHTGRSRNDQVALDLRLWLRDACDAIADELDALMRAFIELARAQGDVVMPSYTHVQRAQPIVVGAECMAWHAMFERDREAFAALRADPLGLGASPLGSGAVAGSTLPLDRDRVAKELGFAGPARSSIDATASRDEALDFLYLCTRTALHLSRLAEQWILYCSTEFAFLKLGEAYTTGSSMMPQKRNPDMLELVRGKSGSIAGHFAALQTILKGLPLAYNRDLQEDKRHVFGAFDVLADCLRISAGVVGSAQFCESHIKAGLERGHLDATVLAEYLVGRGVAFRTAHQIVGALVRECDRLGRDALARLTLDEIRAVMRASGHERVTVDREVYEHLGAANAVHRYRSKGHAGSSPGGYKDWLSGEASPVGGGRATGAADTARDAGPAGAGLFGPSTSADDADGLGPDWAGVVAAYERIGRTLDDLPYTTDFDSLLAAARVQRPDATHREVFRRLQNLRKAGKLPRVGRSETLPVKLLETEERWLTDEVTRVAGSLGHRDQLVYDQRFDALVEKFNAHTGRTLTPHSLWRLVAKLAK